MVKHAARNPRQMLLHALEGEVAGMAPHERRERKEHESDNPDEALEETFPASDPVSAKRIT